MALRLITATLVVAGLLEGSRGDPIVSFSTVADVTCGHQYYSIAGLGDRCHYDEDLLRNFPSNSFWAVEFPANCLCMCIARHDNVI